MVSYAHLRRQPTNRRAGEWEVVVRLRPLKKLMNRV